MEALKRLDYLDACIKESFRLYPAVPLIARQIYTPINLSEYINQLINYCWLLNIDFLFFIFQLSVGTEVPAGSTVLVNTYLLHRDPRHFPRPEDYCPERFLPDSPKPQTFSYLPFSAGSRNCIGLKFAQMEVKVIVLKILRAFEIRSVQSEEQLRLISELVLLNKDGIRLSITPRN